MKPARRTRIQILALAALLALCLLQTQARGIFFLYPLQSEHVREAYFLARSADSTKLNAFLNRYIRDFPLRFTGASVESIEFRTPFDLVVQRTLEKQFNYSAQDAQQDFAEHRDLVVVRIVISIAPVATQVTSPIKGIRANPWPTADDDRAAERSLDSWFGFRFKVAQEKAIAAKKLSTVDVTPPDTNELTVERAIELQFDASQFSSGTATVEVTCPEAKIVRAEFDLGKLK